MAVAVARGLVPEVRLLRSEAHGVRSPVQEKVATTGPTEKVVVEAGGRSARVLARSVSRPSGSLAPSAGKDTTLKARLERAISLR